MQRCRLPALIVFCLTLAAGCGYHLAGSGSLPGEVRTIGITMLANRTSLSGLEAIVGNALADEFSRRRPNLVADVSRAEALLGGTIESMSTESIARSSTLTALERRMVISVSLVLRGRKGEVLWNQRLTADATYMVQDQRPDTESNLRAAGALAARRLAEYAFARMTQRF